MLYNILHAILRDFMHRGGIVVTVTNESVSSELPKSQRSFQKADAAAHSLHSLERLTFYQEYLRYADKRISTAS